MDSYRKMCIYHYVHTIKVCNLYMDDIRFLIQYC